MPPRTIIEVARHKSCRAPLSSRNAVRPRTATPVLDDATFAERTAAVRDALV
ncbi:hypothetical protein [Halostagnicola sp. A-GB9-2]|uniref:hypothetical protein n=1 Tax=Halostagnicola sp. A-GB9-2 TaxID=3048066 RepID=UPI0024BF8E6A|nr:hypothetical protein [Halostagnicola sp. A-GB9-2]MDJ1430581.1 hypothetical protein [Halostagnicola sp. A-GB9-2]